MSEKKNDLADAVATLVQYGYFEEAKAVIERMKDDTFPLDFPTDNDNKTEASK